MVSRIAALLTLVMCGCSGDVLNSAPPMTGEPAVPGAPTDPTQPGAVDPVTGEPAPPPFVAAPARMHTLTSAQLTNTLQDLFGPLPTLAVPRELDVPGEVFVRFGTTHIALTGNVLEKLETLALTIADYLFDTPSRREALISCNPTPTDGCVRTGLTRLAAKVWRRSATPAELDTLMALANKVSTQFNDAWQGPKYAFVALLVSPHFLYRFERGEGGRYSSQEMASRLSYAIWNSTPDADLLAAAARDELQTADQVRSMARRMLDQPRAADAARAHFAEALAYSELDSMVKDRDTFPRMSPTLGKSMQTELQRAVDDLVFTRKADLRELFTLQGADVDAELAGLYGVPAPMLLEPTEFTVTGGGINLWGPTDSFHFVYRQLVGDGEIIARVDSMGGSLDWAKAAVMMRESFDNDSRHVLSTISATHGSAFKWRAEKGAPTQVKEGFPGAAPAFVKLTRVGNTITGSSSTDGSSWVVMNTMTTAMPATVWVGVAFTNQDDTKVNTARFSQVKVTGAGAKQWVGRDIGQVRVAGVSSFTASSEWAPMVFKDQRVGIMGFAGVLARASKISETSPTGRGLFVRERLLCQSLPPAPVDVDTSFPAEMPNAAPRTMRERLTEHRANPACAACHVMMDPIGLALENYDGLGEWRNDDHGAAIDDSGELDGVSFNGLTGLMGALKDNRDAQRCLVRQVYRNVTGRHDEYAEEAAVRAAAQPLVEHGANYFDVLVDVVSSDGFRLATAPN